MKALEILQRIKRHEVVQPDKIENAISELEALQHPKSCEGCKHFNKRLNYNDCDRGVADNVHLLNDDVYITVSLDFCCSKYEAKG